MSPAMSSANDGFATPERNRFYYGKLMDVVHFSKEQDYFNRKRWLLNRLIAGSGVVAGLSVGTDPQTPGNVIVQPGMAIDGLGREIMVPAPVSVNPLQLSDDQGTPAGPPIASAVGVTVSLAYFESEADPAAVLVADCDRPGNCACGTIREQYRLLVRKGIVLRPVPACGLQDGLPLPVQDNLQKLLADRIAGPPPDGVQDPSVPLASFDATNTLESRQGRPLVYSNALLFEMILCLADQVSKLAGK